MKTIAGMLGRLERNPQVTGLIRYGSDHHADGYSVGDYDLFVVLSSQPTVESLHFSVESTPVDLNLITLEALTGQQPTSTFPQLALSNGSVLFDRTAKVGPALARLKEALAQTRPEAPSAHTVAFLRHGHRHLLDKVRGRFHSEPLLSRFLLGVNPYWLMENYFRVRRLPFRGERHALEYWRRHEPELYGVLEAFYRTTDVEEQFGLTERLTDLVLAPVGGAWRQGEVLAFGTDVRDDDLADEGVRVYRELFGDASEGSR